MPGHSAIEGITAAGRQGAMLLDQIVLRPLQATAAEQAVYGLHGVILICSFRKQTLNALLEPPHQLAFHAREDDKVNDQHNASQNAANNILQDV